MIKNREYSQQTILQILPDTAADTCNYHYSMSSLLNPLKKKKLGEKIKWWFRGKKYIEEFDLQ